MTRHQPALPEGFVYPVGYKVSRKRVIDPEILKDFKDFEHPYVITYKGKTFVDDQAPVAVARLRNGRDSNLNSAIRWLELEGPPDESMQATYNCEDALATACNYSEAGFHKTAIDLIRSLPEPFQKTRHGMEAVARSLIALERYEEALDIINQLTTGREEITEYYLTLLRLEKVHLLTLLGRVDEAESILNARRLEFREMYQYYGQRAALALARGDEALAKALIVRSGRVDPYHCFKILWNPLLKPLESFIRKELLTEKGQPLIYKQDNDLHMICNRIQGAVLIGNRELAANLFEGLVMERVTAWITTHEAMLALAGLGRFEKLFNYSHTLPGSDHAPVILARLVSAAITSQHEGGFTALEEFLKREDGDWKHPELLLQAARLLANWKPFVLPDDFELLLFEAARKNWSSSTRELFLLHAVGRGFRLTTLCEPRRKRPSSLWGTDLREAFPVTDTREFSSVSEAEVWIEEKLAENAVPRPHPCTHIPIWTSYLNGWSLLTSMKPSEKTPLLKEAWETASIDPNYYFMSPAHCYSAPPGSSPIFEVGLLQMLVAASYSLLGTQSDLEKSPL
jgi:hypothetical protein